MDLRGCFFKDLKPEGIETLKMFFFGWRQNIEMERQEDGVRESQMA